MSSKKKQKPRRITHSEKIKANTGNDRKFNYALDYKKINLRDNPELYRVGVGEQGVLLVEPYKSEILPFWKFKTPALAFTSATAIYKLFLRYLKNEDFIGMDMARKYLQMGFTRSRRYANHKSGAKYNSKQIVLPLNIDRQKAISAEIFFKHWKKAERNPHYADAKLHWRYAFG